MGLLTLSIRSVPKYGKQKLRLLLKVLGFPNQNLTQYIVVGENCIWPTGNQLFTLITALERVPAKSGY